MKMNSQEIYKELANNESDKILAKNEIKQYQKKWADYVINNKDKVMYELQPIVVKKKNKVCFKEFIGKIKKMFGFEKRKEEIDGIEAYLQYSNSDE